MNTKQVIVIRKDLKMRRGKEIAQGAHAATAWMSSVLIEIDREASAMEPGDAAVACYRSPSEKNWFSTGMTKICCQVNSEEELFELNKAAITAGLKSHLILDEGRTEFGGTPTYTCLAIGPNESDKIDLVTGKLELY
jgi:PTH2 family peptidyl-tRNA hydrolase